MKEAFNVDINEVPVTDKSNQPLDAVDEMATTKGYLSRAPRKKIGKPRSLRTAQVHAKIYPKVREYLLAEATKRGVQQGVIIEEALELYKNRTS